MRIAICDDLQDQRNHLRCLLAEYFAKNDIRGEILAGVVVGI